MATAEDMAGLLSAARDTLNRRLQTLADQGEAWPRPTPIEALSAGAGALLLVDVQVDDPPVRVNISIGEQLLRRLDAAAETQGMSRSGFIAQAVRASLGERQRMPPEFDAAAKRLQEELSTVGRRLNESIGPNSAFSKSMDEFDNRVNDAIRRAADGVSQALGRRKGPPPAADAEL